MGIASHRISVENLLDLATHQESQVSTFNSEVDPAKPSSRPS